MDMDISRNYGWKPDLPDHRDLRLHIPDHIAASLPSKVDLRPQCPAIYDQGQLGSCTANAIAGAIQFDQMKEGIKTFVPSRLFIYYNERIAEGTSPSEDSGAMIRDGIKSVASLGVCEETLWTYDTANKGDAPCPTCAYAQKPVPYCYKMAAIHTVKAYYRLDSTNLSVLKGCLASGYPFVFGFTVYASFESQQTAMTGIVPLPGSREQMVGGHAVLCVGYDDASQRFIVRNSWGTDWGQAGYCMMPYAYLTNSNLADDFWKVKVTT